MSLHEPAHGTTRVPPEVFSDAAFCEKYRIEHELGVGGAGVVVRAVHLELDRRVAIKFLLPHVAHGDALVRFRREAWAASRIRDEHVVKIIDVAKIQSGLPYVVMEYLDGTDLERMLLESPDRQLPVRDAIEFILQACEALAESHQIGIVHRDLKPSNLFCVEAPDRLPRIKVLDFGISKFSAVSSDGGMTGEHAILGSPRYMSPEQFDSPADVDQRTDLWALGVILYEFVTGRTPFEGKSVLEIWNKVKTHEPAPLHELRRDVPLGLEPAIRKCLEKDPNRRYQNVAEFARDLAQVASERARGSIARIVRIVESPGVSTESLALAHSPASGSPSTVSVLPKPPSFRIRGGVLLALSALGLGLGLFSAFRRAPSPLHASKPPESALPASKPPEAAPAQGEPPPLVVASATASAPLREGAPAAAPSPVPSAPAARVSTRRANVSAPPSASPVREGTPPPDERVEEPTPALAEPIAASTAVASSGLVATSTASAAPKSPPAVVDRGPRFLVDIVDQRKPKPAGTRP